MASLSAMVPRHLIRESLAKYLPTRDLATVVTLDSHAKASVEDAQIWWESASRALPSFVLSQDFFATASSRAAFLPCLGTLRQAEVAEGVQVPLNSMGEVRKLCKLLGLAHKVAEGHRDRGCHLARAVIGSLAFEHATVAAAFEGNLNQEWGPGREGGSAMCYGTSALVIGGPSVLRVHFAWQYGVLLVSARDDDLTTREIAMPREFPDVFHSMMEDQIMSTMPLTLDIVSFSSVLTLNHRGVAVPTNSSWQAVASGIFSLTKGKKAARDELVSGVLCVFCVRDGMPEHSMNLAKTLHLDTPQR